MQLPQKTAVTPSLAAAPTRLGLPLKVIYGLGEISNSLKSFSFGLFVLFFYTSVLGLPGGLAGLSIALGLIWDAVVDPLIGLLSDRARRHSGGRQGLMLIGSLSMGAAFVAIFTPPAGLSLTGLFVWLLGSSILLRSANSLFIVPYHALGAELSSSYSERASVTGVRTICAMVGTLLASLASFTLFFPNLTPGVDPKFNPAGYGQMGLAFGVTITTLGILVTCVAGTRGGAPTPTAAQPLGLVPGLRLALRNRPFVVLTLSAATFFLASVVNATVAIHYLTYYAQITESRALSLFQVSFFVGGVVGALGWAALARRFEKQQLYVVAALGTAAVMAASYLALGAERPFPATALLLTIANTVAGLFASGIWVLSPSMIADVTDLDRMETGQRREGIFFGIYSFTQQVAASLAVVLSGVLLERFVNLVPNAVAQTAQAIERIGMTFGLLPAAIIVLATAVILGYRLSRNDIDRIQRSLSQAERGR